MAKEPKTSAEEPKKTTSKKTKIKIVEAGQNPVSLSMNSKPVFRAFVGEVVEVSADELAALEAANVTFETVK